jgi:preprotein translocase subunit SecA
MLTGWSRLYLSPVWRKLTSLLPTGTYARRLRQIDSFEPLLLAADDMELRRRSLALRYRSLSGEPLSQLLPESYALMREAARRTLNMRHFEVQLVGGIALHFGSIAEMQTGEGKTLTATLPLYLAALAGRGAHLTTVNDYLASRDAALMRPAFELLGMTVGAIESATPRSQRRQAYKCDVTYAASREFGFDFLRDRLLMGRAADRREDLLGRMLGQPDESLTVEPVQRELHFCLVDEADSILIDEARTPLIVSSLPGNSADTAIALFQWSAEVAPQFRIPQECEYEHSHRRVTLTAAGRRLVRELPKPDALATIGMLDMYEHVERAILVEREYIRDHHYVIRDDEIVIVDEFTGRLAEGRKWRDGIHQAIEAKESVRISLHSGEAARVTVQDFFLQYGRLAGMTGTAANSNAELRRIYRLRVAVIPTHRPCRRVRLPDRVFGTATAKWQAVVDEVRDMHAQGRPVLIGTRTIDKSEHLSKLLTDAGIPHDVLNAKNHATEAAIVARAGEKGRVTVATNMAGRGTDIKLGPGVADLGGLHVICTELHESARIDRQLVGRCARQGDPGSSRQYSSLDDDILRSGLGPKKAAALKKSGERQPNPPAALAGSLRRAQAKVERDNFRQRRMLLYHHKERRRMQQQMGQDPYLDAGT